MIYLDENSFYNMTSDEMLDFVKNELNYANRFGKEVFVEVPTNKTEEEGSEFNKFFLDSFMLWNFNVIYETEEIYVLSPISKV